MPFKYRNNGCARVKDVATGGTYMRAPYPAQLHVGVLQRFHLELRGLVIGRHVRCHVADFTVRE